MSTVTTTQRSGLEVWVGCLGCYNEGRLVGEWIPAESALDITVARLHRGRPTDHEELWCLDLDGFPISREMGLDEAVEWGEAFAAVDPDDRPALSAWVTSGDYVAQGDGDVPSIDEFRDRYAGRWSTFRDFTEHWAEETCLFDQWCEQAQQYFDWDRFARDLAYDFVVADGPDGDVFVFYKQ